MVPGGLSYHVRLRSGPDAASPVNEAILRTNKFGTGPDVSVIGQGTWYIDRGDRKNAVAALRRGIDLGMNHIDTAEMYGDAEPVVAEAIAGRRDDVFLVSKVLPSNASRRGTITACERSLMTMAGLVPGGLSHHVRLRSGPLRLLRRTRRSCERINSAATVPMCP